MAKPDQEWKKPGAGCWVWDPDHFSGALTPIYQDLLFPNAAAGFGAAFERLGLPLRTIEWRTVHGKVYRRLMPLVMPEREPVPMPAFLLWIVLRTMPEMRRRERAAEAAFASRFWREESTTWYEVERPKYEAANRALQDVDLSALDDAGLIAHLHEVFDHASAGIRRHFELHGSDFTPLGDLSAHAEDWGLDPEEVLGLLAGSSPATTAAADSLGKLVAEVAGRFPSSLDEVRAISPAAAAALDEHLERFGWRLVTTYDIDGQTLGEMPDMILGTIVAAAETRAPTSLEATCAALRERVPAAERDTFDVLLTEARSAYGLRDDNGIFTMQWPCGLLRRALLGIGRRLVEQGALESPRHAVELRRDELEGLLLHGRGPTSAEIAERARSRAEYATIVPPTMLGKPESEPPEAVLPKHMARSVRVLKAVIGHVDAALDGEPMVGVGVGSESYTGRARLLDHGSDDLFGTFEVGDVLVAPFTVPAYNTLLFVAGAVVCEVGGALSHAAVMARELGIPAVVGAGGVMSRISDGDLVTVDPTTGTVTLAGLGAD